MTTADAAALRSYLNQLRSWYIVEREDYFLYTPEDHSKALAFRLLASAALEGYIENRLWAVAEAAMERLKRSQSTAAGRALLSWYIYERKTLYLPIRADEILQHVAEHCDNALKKYLTRVTGTHGMSDSDFLSLVVPLGVRETDIDVQLTANLRILSKDRNRAAHVRTSRAKKMEEPKAEADLVFQIVSSLDALDASLDALVHAYP
ncbi:hypothetical protein [Actinoplanes sp. HUAS TT8]|uniref:hypothetical protein n=1 Tax=Actinoplanes sp. HUAS TT8 TaxID=3447453 RepID=UPI003F5202A0